MVVSVERDPQSPGLVYKPGGGSSAVGGDAGGAGQPRVLLPHPSLTPLLALHFCYPAFFTLSLSGSVFPESLKVVVV